jgi:septal ring factor EnvC (AmiA/AmiB activator)
MITNEVTVNIYLLASILGISVLAGFALRAKMILKCRAKIEELEREILNNYEHILELERETSNMESQMQDIKSPVITMKAQNKEPEVISKKVPDISLRKQLLSKKNIEQQSASGL